MIFLDTLKQVEIITSCKDNDILVRCSVGNCKEELFKNYGIVLAGTIVDLAAEHYIKAHKCE